MILNYQYHLVYIQSCEKCSYFVHIILSLYICSTQYIVLQVNDTLYNTKAHIIAHSVFLIQIKMTLSYFQMIKMIQRKLHISSHCSELSTSFCLFSPVIIGDIKVELHIYYNYLFCFFGTLVKNGDIFDVYPICLYIYNVSL